MVTSLVAVHRTEVQCTTSAGAVVVSSVSVLPKASGGGHHHHYRRRRSSSHHNSSAHHGGGGGGDGGGDEQRPVLVNDREEEDYDNPHNDDNNRPCRGCRSRRAFRTDWAQGDKVCTNCGLVDQEHVLDQGPEWREFQDDATDAKSRLALARSGLLAVDETRYWGGLQPTTLSKYLFGGPVAAAANALNSNSSAVRGSTNVRQRLYAANRRMDRLMEKMQTRDIQSVLLAKRVQQRRKERSIEQQRRNVDDNDDDDDTTLTDMDTSGTSDLRPEYVQLLESEEEYTSRMQMALHADKWSLTRAIKLFGRPDQQQDGEYRDSTDAPFASSSSTRRGRQQQQQLHHDYDTKVDATLREASRDLYRAYLMLEGAARRLHLPDRVLHEATNMLCQYAAKCDGLCVRGIATNARNRETTTAAVMATTTTISQGGKTLKEFNKVKQMGALCSGLLFLIARNLGWPRSMREVCHSVHVLDAMGEHASITTSGSTIGGSPPSSSGLDDGPQDDNDEFIKKKHCSRAMDEIKQHFADLSRSSSGVVAVLTGSASPSSSLTGVTAMHADSTRIATTGAGALGNFTDHSLRKLALPPVAEAGVRCLVVYWQHRPDSFASIAKMTTHPSNSHSSNLSTVCAGLGYFVCLTGTIMQQLARQAKKRPAVAKASFLDDSSTARRDNPAVVAQKRIKLTNTRFHNESDDRSFGVIGSHHEQRQPLNHNEDDENDAHVAAREEHRAYEMRRMWDAWSEQTSWTRTLGDIEQSCGVPRATILDFYKRQIHPERDMLLNILRGAVVLTDTAVGGSPRGVESGGLVAVGSDGSSECCPDAVGTLALQHELGLLNDTPLASILLPHVSIAAPLMKASPQL